MKRLTPYFVATTPIYITQPASGQHSPSRVPQPVYIFAMQQSRRTRAGEPQPYLAPMLIPAARVKRIVAPIAVPKRAHWGLILGARMQADTRSEPLA